MDKERYKKYRLFLISNHDNLMRDNKIWKTKTTKQKWKSIYKFIMKLEKIDFNKNGEVKVAQ